nr:MAG TPA: hypothetical protein [Caudoviricetes sp.]
MDKDVHHCLGRFLCTFSITNQSRNAIGFRKIFCDTMRHKITSKSCTQMPRRCTKVQPLNLVDTG